MHLYTKQSYPVGTICEVMPGVSHSQTGNLNMETILLQAMLWPHQQHVQTLFSHAQENIFKDLIWTLNYITIIKPMFGQAISRFYSDSLFFLLFPFLFVMSSLTADGIFLSCFKAFPCYFLIDRMHLLLAGNAIFILLNVLAFFFLYFGSLVFVYLGCHNKISQSGYLKQQKFILT